MSLSGESWLYRFEDLNTFFAAVPLKDAYTRFYSPVLWLFDSLLSRKPVTEDWSSATSPRNPQVSAPDEERMCGRSTPGSSMANIPKADQGLAAALPPPIGRLPTEDRRARGVGSFRRPPARRRGSLRHEATIGRPPAAHRVRTTARSGRCPSPEYSARQTSGR